MNGHKAMVAALALAALPLLPACTVTTQGRAEANMADLADAIDAKIDADIAAKRAARPTPTTPPRVPAEYAVLGDEIRQATAGIKGYWFRQGIDLNSVKVTTVARASHAPCGTTHGVAEADGWTCLSGQPEVVVYLPLVQSRTDIGGAAYTWFLIGHELGHVVDRQKGVTVSAPVGEALADCLAGAAAAAVGIPEQVRTAVDAVYPTSVARRNSVGYGIDHGYEACIQGAK